MPQVVIVSPALREANNGNWQTARRWQTHLAGKFDTRIVKQWPDARAADDRVMIALHARRSAPAIQAWHARHGSSGLAVVLTGTDLYRDIASNPDAQRSLTLAKVLILLQECAPQSLPEHYQSKARVIFQSTTARQALPKSAGRLRLITVGHLRPEKSPETLYAAARLLAAHHDIFIDHIGDALEPTLADAARATMAVAPHYRWLGPQPHEDVRRRIQRAHLLVHPSCMEGGAHVIMEAVASHTPVLASHVEGNIGMLGADYGGYFPVGDAQTLVNLILRCRDRPGNPPAPSLLDTLAAQCALRAPLFQPAAERASLRRLVNDLLGAT